MDRTTLSQTPPLSGAIGLRRRIAGAALEAFGAWGYREIDVPLLDYFDPLRRVLDPKLVNRMFRLVDRDGNLLVLRGDVTPAIAKIFAYQLSDLPLPLRVCYSNKVVRIERAFTREQIENFQLGVELIGAPGVGPEVEILLLTLETLEAVGIGDFEVHLGNSAIADRLISLTGADKRTRDALLSAVGERDPQAVEQLLNGLSVDSAVRAKLLELTNLRFGRKAVDTFRDAMPQDEALESALDQLQKLYDVLEELQVSTRIFIDLGLVNDQGYYTGTAFKVVSERVGRVLGGGGRYDELIGRFGKPTPAVGFSFSLEAIIELIYPGELRSGEPRDNHPVRRKADSVPESVVALFRDVIARRARNERIVIDHED